VSDIMEIQGVWMPLDVLKYITSFVYFRDDRESLKHAHPVFERALTESPIEPHVFVTVNYGHTEHGLVTTVESLSCLYGKVHVYIDRLNMDDLMFRLRDGRQFLYGGSVNIRWHHCHLSNRSWEHVCATTGAVGQGTVLLNEDREEIIRQMIWLRQWLPREFARLYNQANGRNLLKHKRPRKRVKRFGF
jgi:hypothetical protein